MNVARVSSLLLVAGIRNRVQRQIRRMKQPKYLIATLVGASYLWSVLLRRVRFSEFRAQIPSQAFNLVEALLIFVALATIVGAWVLGSDRAELSFSEAEVQFLFPAPITRRSLLAYRLSKGVFRTFFSALLVTIFSPSFAGRPVLFFFGAWISLSILTMHLTGTALTRATLLQGGRAGLRRRIGTLLVAAAVIAGVVWWTLRAVKPDSPEPWTFESAVRWVDALTYSAPLSWVLFPIRAPIHLALSRSLRDFFLALPAALAVAAVHVAWVLSSNASFEEASVEAAERRARAAESRRASRGRSIRIGKSRRVPFRLASSGRPEVALIWKNLIAAMRVSVPRTLLVMGVMVLALGASGMKRLPMGPAIGGACVALACVLVLLGPNALRIDLRHDLAQMDILRSLPMSGRQVVIAELLGPGLIVAGMQWALLIAAVALSASYPIPRFDLPRRMAIAFAIALLAPALTFASLLVQNVAVLLFPGWMTVDPNAPRGVEALGQRLLTVAGGLIAMFVGVLPALVCGAVVWAILWKGMGLFAVPFASFAAAGVIGTELYLAIRWVGTLFDRFDVTLP